MKHIRHILTAGALAAACLFMAAAPAHAAQAPAKKGAKALTLPVEKYVLSNGLRVLFLRDMRSPTVTTYMQFNVGSVDERPGITGMAHFLEHMVFKGSEKLGTTHWEAEKPMLERQHALYGQLKAEKMKGEKADKAKLEALEKEFQETSEKLREFIIEEELWSQYLENGGDGLNASTSYDTTQYFVSLPSNRLELWCWLESDRMMNPVFRDFYPERQVVKEERRMRYDNEPDGLMQEALYALMFMAHPYHWPVIGWMSDLDAIGIETMYDFYRTYYAPNNAVAVFAGDLDPAAALPLIKKYMERVPAQTPPPPVETMEPEQRGERRAEIAFEASPQVLIGYKAPAGLDPDLPAVQAFKFLMADGRTSRLYRKLVEELQIAASVEAEMYPGEARFPTGFIIAAVPREGRTTAELEEAIYAEIDRVAREGVEAWEMDKLRNGMEAAFVQIRNHPMAMAGALAKYELLGGWENLLVQHERAMKLKPADIQQAAAKYFQPHLRSVVTLVDARAAGAGEEK